MKYRVRSPLAGPFEFEADTATDAYGKFCDKAGYTVYAACTIEGLGGGPSLSPMYLMRAAKFDYEGRK